MSTIQKLSVVLIIAVCGLADCQTQARGSVYTSQSSVKRRTVFQSPIKTDLLLAIGIVVGLLLLVNI